jgi:hypothetical protein
MARHGCSEVATIERLCQRHIVRVTAWCEGINRWNAAHRGHSDNQYYRRAA